MAFKATYVQQGASVDHTPVSAVGAGDVVVIGNQVLIAKNDIAAGQLGALAAEGLFRGAIVNESIDAGEDVYYDVDGTPANDDYGAALSGAFTKDPTKGPYAGYAVEDDDAADGSILFNLRSRDGAVSVARSALVQNDLQSYPITVNQLRVWDAPNTDAADSGANDDLGVIYNTFLTEGPSVETGDVKAANAVTRKVGFQFAVPPEYVAGQSITFRAHAGMKTTVAGTSATIDFQCARQADPTVDLCATAAQSINSLVAADKDFTITPDNVVPGDVLDCVVTVATNDAASGTAVIGKISKMEMLLDIKG